MCIRDRATRAVPSAAIGVSSFGYSGTIVHAVLRAAPGEAGRGALARRVECGPQYRRRRFGWRETPHPLAEARLDAAGDCAAVRFRSASDGWLRSLVADHVVLGRVLFPAAGFLEMARAACAASRAAELGADTPVGLRRAFFMQPLPLGESGGLWVEVSADAAAERLEVASYGQEEGAARTAHFACGLAGAGAEPGGAAPPSLASARALCPVSYTHLRAHET